MGRRRPCSGPCRMPRRRLRASGAGPSSASGFRPLAPKAVARLGHDWERLVTFYPFPREHWRHLRTTNVVESPFAAVRLRTTAAKRDKRVESATALIWKLLQVAEQSFRRLNAPELLPLVHVGVRFVNGVQQPATPKEVAA
ncbi:MAG: transposase [Nitrospirota bacterium]